MQTATRSNAPLYPWSDLYDRHYISTGKNGRKSVSLHNKYGDRFSTSYARYLMAIKLGHYVPIEFDVDHINNDPSDDRIENLQLLSREENRNKYIKHRLDSMSDTIDSINKYAGKGYYSTRIARILNIDRSTVKKYSAVPLANGVKEANPKLLNKDIKDKINEFAIQGKSCHQISKLLNISGAVIKKYAEVPLANGRKEAHPNIIKQDIIDKINNYAPDINNDQIARYLNIDHTTVKKYRTTKYKDGRKPSKYIEDRSKTPKDIIALINSEENKYLSIRVLARKLNLDRTIVRRYRVPIDLNSDILMLLKEAIEYRKSNLTLKQIRDRLSIGKNTMSAYANYINNDAVKKKLLDYKIEAYAEGTISEAIEKNTDLDIRINDNNNYIPFGLDCIKTYSAYDEMQTRALKVFYESSGDFTIYSTIEAPNSDDIFLTISGSK